MSRVLRGISCISVSGRRGLVVGARSGLLSRQTDTFGCARPHIRRPAPSREPQGGPGVWQVMPTEPAVHGHADPPFAAVADTLRASLRAGEDVGAAVTVYWQGRKVVDLWGGLADRWRGRP